MVKESRIAVRGKIKGYFEIHFEGVLEKEALIRRKQCNGWNEIAAVFILSGKHSNNEEFNQLFEKHFNIKLQRVQTVHELCTKWNAWDEWMKRNDEHWEDTHP